MPSGKSRTLLPVSEALCNRTPFARRGRAASAIVRVAIGVMNGIEHQPEHIAFKLERTHGLALKLGRVAILERDRKRLVRIALRLCGAATDGMEDVWGHARGIWFECGETR